MYPEKTIIEKDTCTPVFIPTLFTIARTWKQARCPLTDEWIKLWYIYTVEYFFSFKETVLTAYTKKPYRELKNNNNNNNKRNFFFA